MTKWKYPPPPHPRTVIIIIGLRQTAGVAVRLWMDNTFLFFSAILPWELAVGPPWLQSKDLWVLCNSPHWDKSSQFLSWGMDSYLFWYVGWILTFFDILFIDHIRFRVLDCFWFTFPHFKCHYYMYMFL